MSRISRSGARCRTPALLVCVASALVFHSGSAAQRTRVNADTASCAPAATPPAGPLCGTTESTVVNGDTVTVNVYRGIPYAVPTTLNNNAGRWQPPSPFPAWTTPRQAADTSAICPQLQYSAVTQRNTVIGGSEDCLYLNVWQPPTASDSSALPVMVFIHGGTFIAGAGSMGAYDGAYLAAAGNVVVVTINYRLGALGWLTADTLHAAVPPNLGLQDQQLALQWVQGNIGAFGGDSAQVTLFGESAGAMSVGLHLFSVPGSAPLFRAAIMESNLMALPYRGTNEARADGAEFVGQLCSRYGGQKCPGTLGWLQGLTTQQIMEVDTAYQGSTMKSHLQTYGLPEIIPWSPVADGSFVTGQPAAGYAAGMPAKPYVFGMNLNEGVLFSYLVAAAIDSFNLFAGYKKMVEWLYGSQNGSRITRFKSATGYHPYSEWSDSSTAYLDHSQMALSNVLNDGLFHCGNLASADSALLANQPDSLPIFGYLFVQPPVFNHPPPLVPPCVPQAGNVCHTYELPYVFNNFAYWAVQPGSGQPTAADSTLARGMSAAWANFATTLGPPASGWQPYTANGGLYTWGGNNTGSMVQGWSGTRNCTGLWYKLPPLGN